jgi:hypothetical protein
MLYFPIIRPNIIKKAHDVACKSASKKFNFTVISPEI